MLFDYTHNCPSSFWSARVWPSPGGPSSHNHRQKIKEKGNTWQLCYSLFANLGQLERLDIMEIACLDIMSSTHDAG